MAEPCPSPCSSLVNVISDGPWWTTDCTNRSINAFLLSSAIGRYMCLHTSKVKNRLMLNEEVNSLKKYTIYIYIYIYIALTNSAALICCL